MQFNKTEYMRYLEIMFQTKKVGKKRAEEFNN